VTTSPPAQTSLSGSIRSQERFPFASFILSKLFIHTITVKTRSSRLCDFAVKTIFLAFSAGFNSRNARTTFLLNHRHPASATGIIVFQPSLPGSIRSLERFPFASFI
jgi:hypothetical protein